LNLDGILELLVYADDVYILEGGVHIIKKNTKPLVVVSKENEREVTTDKTKYVAMTRVENAGKSHNIKIYFLLLLKGWKLSNIWKQP